MNRHGPVALLLLLVLAAGLAGPPRPADASETEQVLVRYRSPAAGDQAVAALGREVAVAGRRSVPGLDLDVVTVPAGEAVSAAARLESLASVAYAEPAAPVRALAGPSDPVGALAMEPDDPHWPSQWGPRRVNAPAAWETTTGSGDVVVAVLDTGVSAHPDLPGALLPGRNFLAGEDPTDVTDHNGHGTAVAGVVAARGDNGIGMAGVCWACRVLPGKVLDDQGNGTTAEVVEGIVWAADEGADVVNLSLGGPTGGRAMADAVAYAAGRGAVVVGAAGNAGVEDLTYPAAYEEVVAVAGSQRDDVRYDWSNFGAWVDVAAPGCNVVTAVGGGYGSACGTSFAAPLVSGAAALGISAAPEATPAQVRAALEITATPLDYVAHGRIRADATLDALTTEPDPDPEPDPEPEPAPDPEDEPPPEPLPDVDPVEACPPDQVPPSGLTDLGDGVHRPSIECVVWYGIAQGFADGTYRPARAIRRDQLATFVVAQLEVGGVTLPEPGETTLTDIDGNVHERSIRQLAELGVVQGRSGTRYDPAGLVTRAQMATFLWRAHEVVTGDELPVTERHFDDIADSVHRDPIDALASAGVVDGRAERTYAPQDTVRRSAMASFMVKHLQVLAAEGHVTHP